MLNFHRLGGSGIVAYEIARALIRRGHKIHFVGLKPPFRNNLADSNITFHPISLQIYPVFDFQPFTLALASQLSELIVKCNIEVIHSHYAIPHAVAALLARDIAQKKVNCITTLHGTDITVVGLHPSMYNITKYSIEKSNHVTAVSDYLNRKTCSNFSLPKNKIKTIHNFIGSEVLYSRSTKSKKLSGKNVSLIHSSNLREIKAPLEVIEIFSKLVQSDLERNYHLGILGDGPLKDKMIALTKKLKLDHQITFYGEKLHFNDIYEKADFFLLPSYDESFGLAALEAMSFGMVVFARDVGGLGEIIDHEKDGFLFCEDHRYIVGKINDLLNDPKLYEKISRASYEKVLKKFTPEKIMNEYEKLYFDF